MDFTSKPYSDLTGTAGESNESLWDAKKALIAAVGPKQAIKIRETQTELDRKPNKTIEERLELLDNKVWLADYQLEILRKSNSKHHARLKFLEMAGPRAKKYSAIIVIAAIVVLVNAAYLIFDYFVISTGYLSLLMSDQLLPLIRLSVIEPLKASIIEFVGKI